MHHRQGDGLEQPDPLAGEDGQALGVRQVARALEELLHPVEVAGDLVGDARAPARAAAGPAAQPCTRFLTLIRYLPRERSRGSSFR